MWNAAAGRMDTTVALIRCVRFSKCSRVSYFEKSKVSFCWVLELSFVFSFPWFNEYYIARSVHKLLAKVLGSK